MATESKIPEAKEKILELMNDLKVAYDRELRYRLETYFAHDIVGKAIEELVEERKILRTGLPGKRGAGDMPNVFYRLPGTNYRELLPLMKTKLDLSIFIAGVSSAMGHHAEQAWWKAFKRNNWYVCPETEEKLTRGIKEWGGVKTTVNNDIDFVVVKDDIEYGVEIKNGLAYPKDLYWKVWVAAEIGLIPLLICRWLNPRQVRILKDFKIPFIIYREALYSTTYADIVAKARDLLGIPILAKDDVDDEYFQKRVCGVHANVKNNYDEILAKLDEFLHSKDPSIRKGLGDKKTSK